MRGRREGGRGGGGGRGFSRAPTCTLRVRVCGVIPVATVVRATSSTPAPVPRKSRLNWGGLLVAIGVLVAAAACVALVVFTGPLGVLLLVGLSITTAALVAGSNETHA